MATSYWNPFGVALNVTATGGTVTRTSATTFTVKINASWQVYWSGNQTNYGMTASAGGGSANLNTVGNKTSSGSGSFTGTFSISGYGAQTKNIEVTFRNYNDAGDSAYGYVSFNVSVPAWPSYTVSYNANGGTSAPSSQTKYKDTTLKLSTTKPTRTGYSFKNWNTASGGTGTTYESGANYTANSAVTLYAQWTANTYIVNYDANGGSGAPGNQTKTYGVDLTLSSTKPTRTNYNFLGWSTNKNATTAEYSSGGTYTANSAATLYAVWELAYWKPKITNLKAFRCNSSGTADDFNTYVKVTFDWELCQLIGSNNVTSIVVAFKLPSETSYAAGNQALVTASGTKASSSKVFGGSLDVNQSYDIMVMVSDSKGESTTLTTTLGSAAFPIDIFAEGKGVAFGKAASQTGFHSAWPATFDSTLDVDGAVTLDSTLDVSGAVALDSTLDVGDSVTIPNAKHYYGCNTSGTARSLALINSSNNTYFGNGSYANSEGSTYYQGSTIGIQSKGNIYMTSPSAGLSARAYGVNKVLWSGGAYMNASQTATLSEAISAQPNGIVLVWSWYSGGASNSCFRHFFIPKHQVSAHNTCGVDCARIAYDANMAKYVYIHDTKITGHNLNEGTNTTGGCTYSNSNFVLRYVIGV